MLNFTLQYTHPTLGKLTIRFQVDAHGRFQLDRIKARWRGAAYSAWNFYDVSLWQDWRNNYRWTANFYDRYWGNGWKAGVHGVDTEATLPLMRAIEDFANSPELAAAVTRKLKRSMKQMRQAMEHLRAEREGVEAHS